jgi:hypothetical protein
MERRRSRYPGESPKATGALRHGVELPGKLFGLHELRQRGHRVDLTSRERIDGTDYYALRITLNDGYTTTLYLDPKSWLITGVGMFDCSMSISILRQPRSNYAFLISEK